MPGEDDPTVRDSQASFETSDYVPPAANLAPSIEGQRFGSYQVIREIGRGGMGAVYLAARADDQYKKRVALKILPFGATQSAELLRREARVLASLEHPALFRFTMWERCRTAACSTR